MGTACSGEVPSVSGSRVEAPRGPFKWRDMSGPDADGDVTFSEEQIGADMGAPPEVVRQATWRAGVYGKKGFGKWKKRTCPR